MAKRRLNAWMRDKLYSHLKEIIEPKGFKEKIDAAYERAAPHVRTAVEKKFPPADMVVLKKYNVGGIDDCIKLHLHDGAIAMFYFKADTGPYAAKMTYQHQIYEADVKTTLVFRQWEKAAQNYEEEKKKRYNAYRHLILSSKYLEDVAEVWPEAATLIPPNEPTALIALEPNELSIIQKDMNERKADTN